MIFPSGKTVNREMEAKSRPYRSGYGRELVKMFFFQVKILRGYFGKKKKFFSFFVEKIYFRPHQVARAGLRAKRKKNIFFRKIMENHGKSRKIHEKSAKPSQIFFRRLESTQNSSQITFGWVLKTFKWLSRSFERFLIDFISIFIELERVLSVCADLVGKSMKNHEKSMKNPQSPRKFFSDLSNRPKIHRKSLLGGF